MQHLDRALRTRRRRKVMAVLSAGTAVGLATVVTLAAWNDNEWVFGGAGPGGDPGVGTSTFEVQQDAWDSTPPTVESDTFGDFEDEPGNALLFTVNPGAMTPGDTIYAPVALTTTAASIAGTLQLRHPVPAPADDSDEELWANLTYSVRVTEDAVEAANCRTAFTSSGTLVPAEPSSAVEGLSFDADVEAAPQTLAAARGNVQYYCFAITLPDSETAQELQGKTVYPAWQFAAVSE